MEQLIFFIMFCIIMLLILKCYILYTENKYLINRLDETLYKLEMEYNKRRLDN